MGVAGPVRSARAGLAVRGRGRPVAVRLDVGAGGDDLRRVVRDPAQHHRRARARAAARPMSTSTSVVDRLRARIGMDGPPAEATVEAGHLKRFAEAIGDPNPRWLDEAPPTFLVALAPGRRSPRRGRGIRQGLAERRQPLRISRAGQSRRPDHRDRQGRRRLREDRVAAATCSSSSSRPTTSTSTAAPSRGCAGRRSGDDHAARGTGAARAGQASDHAAAGPVRRRAGRLLRDPLRPGLRPERRAAGRDPPRPPEGGIPRTARHGLARRARNAEDLRGQLSGPRRSGPAVSLPWSRHQRRREIRSSSRSGARTPKATGRRSAPPSSR